MKYSKYSQFTFGKDGELMLFTKNKQEKGFQLKDQAKFTVGKETVKNKIKKISQEITVTNSRRAYTHSPTKSPRSPSP